MHRNVSRTVAGLSYDIPDQEEDVWPQEFTVQYFDDLVGRIVLGKLTRMQYCELWKRGRLDFQWTGRPKPAHLPALSDLEQ
jgi:hypothetical protein